MNIWVPRTRIIEPKREIFLSVSVAGYLRVLGRIGDSPIYEKHPWQPNLLTNTGLNGIWKGTANNVRYGSVGASNQPPAFTDTSLYSFLAYTDTNTMPTTAIVDGPPRYALERRRYEFAPKGSSYNLSEFGMGSTITGTGLGVRALFVDGNGNPVTVPWVAGETLFVEHEFRRYIPETDITGQVTLTGIGTTHNVTIRAAQGASSLNYWCTNVPDNMINVINSAVTTTPNAYSGTIGEIISVPTGTSVASSSRTINGYSENSYSRTVTAIWNPSVANFGIQSFYVQALGGNHQLQFSPVIGKTNLDTLTMTFTCGPVFRQ